MLASGDDGIVEVGVDVPQMPIALIGEVLLATLGGSSGASPKLVESLVVKLSAMKPPAPLSSGREGRSRVHARSALTTGLRGPNPKKQLRLITTQQGKKHSEPETGTLINPSPVGERKPCFYDGHWS